MGWLIASALSLPMASAQNFNCVILNDNNTNLFTPPDACFADPDEPWCDCIRSAFTNPVRGEASSFRQAILWVSQQPGVGYYRVQVDTGTIDLSSLEVGDVIGRGTADELIPVGFPFVGGEFFTVHAETRVTQVGDDGIQFHVIITDVTNGVETAIFYDPTDDAHSNGHLFTGRILPDDDGDGFIIEYRYATENFRETPPGFPGLEPGELAEPFFTVPFLLEFFSAESGIYTLPNAGTVDVTTTLRSFVERSIDAIPDLEVEDPCDGADELSMCRVFDESIVIRESLAGNTPPVARIDAVDAGVFVLIEEPIELQTFCGRAVVLLRGRNSHDGDGGFQNLSYRWSILDSDKGASIPEETVDFRDTHVYFSQPGEFEIGLTVDDGESTDQASVSILVSDDFDINAPPFAVIRSSPEPPELQLNDGFAFVVLDGSESDSGGEGCNQELEYRWSQLSGPRDIVFTSPGVVVTQAHFEFPGLYEIELEVDDGAAVDNLATTTIRVEVFGDPPVGIFRRGDSDDNGDVNVTDSILTLNWLFLGNTSAPECMDAADADDNGDTNLTDAVYSLTFLFLGGDPPPVPGPSECGTDPTGDELPPCDYHSCDA
jgi:hypothetical protein